MLEAVILGVNGVLVPRAAFHQAGIEAAATILAGAGVPPERFRTMARRRLDRHGPSSLISRCLNDLEIVLQPATVRRAVLAARRARPGEAPDARWPGVLRDLAARFLLACLDAGCPESLEGLRAPLGLSGLPALWTERLGESARPPRPLAFRWLARRFEIRPSACLYVAGTGAAWKGARAAGWKVWPPDMPPSDDPDGVEPWSLVEWIDGVEGMQ